MVCDAYKYGNISRFLAHSCDPNIKVHVIINNEFKPILVMHATVEIQIGQELTWMYDEQPNVQDIFHCSCEKCQLDKAIKGVENGWQKKYKRINKNKIIKLKDRYRLAKYHASRPVLQKKIMPTIPMSLNSEINEIKRRIANKDSHSKKLKLKLKKLQLKALKEKRLNEEI